MMMPTAAAAVDAVAELQCMRVQLSRMYRALGDMEAESARLAEAASLYRKAAELAAPDPKLPGAGPVAPELAAVVADLYCALGRSALANGLCETAGRHFLYAQSCDGASVEAARGLAAVHAQSGRPGAARAAARRADALADVSGRAVRTTAPQARATAVMITRRVCDEATEIQPDERPTVMLAGDRDRFKTAPLQFPANSRG